VTEAAQMREIPLRPGRGRRPAAEVRQAALSAAAEILFDTGLRQLTFEKVAQRAGVSKMTLYKWWPSPGALAFEAYSVAVESPLLFPDTGDIVVDLRSQLHSFVRLLTQDRNGSVIGALIGAAQSDPDLRDAFTTSYVSPRRARAVKRLCTARDLGQIRADADLEAVVDQLWGACYHRLLLPARPLTTDFADALLSNLMPGIGPRPDVH
jgi:AcrR family transcriptional regulator